tara:strand:+ start:2291 stop:2440 length:150 start_codon:yes stop_codon:yes gene_type:complete
MNEKEQNYQKHRLRYLPVQLRATRRKLLHLEREAERMGMTHLLEEDDDD